MKRNNFLLSENFGRNNKASVKTKWFIMPFLLAILSLIPFCSMAQHTVYVTPTGAGTHDGFSWQNACTLREAAEDQLTCIQDRRCPGCGDPNTCPRGIAWCGDTLWIKEGTYSIPHDDVARIGFFFTVYGGFAGNETSLAQRNPAQHITKFEPGLSSSNVNIDSVRSGGIKMGTNFLQAGCGNVNTIDGITFDRTYIRIMTSSEAVFNNCIFYGLGIFLDEHARITATNCTFEKGRGLVMEAGQSSNYGTFTNCRFKKLTNYSKQSGALWGPLTARYCTFDSCDSRDGGGAIGGGAFSPQTIENCLFTNNSASVRGGAIWNGGTSKILMNTFINNRSPLGSGIYNSAFQTTIANNILWNQPAMSASTGTVYFDNESASEINNISNDGSIGLMIDPQLQSNYSLSDCSPAINAGNNSHTDGQTTDFAGNTRVFNGTVDIGCYEFQGVRADPDLSTFGAQPVCRTGSITGLITNTGAGTSVYTWYAINGNTVTSLGNTNDPSISINPSNYSGNNASVRFYATEHRGCDINTDTVEVAVVPPLTQPQFISANVTNGDSICRGDSITAHFSHGSGGDISCANYDNLQYSLNGGLSYTQYTDNAKIYTNTASGSVMIRAKYTGCTNCEDIPWQTLAQWPVRSLPGNLSITISASQTEILPGTQVGLHATYYDAGLGHVFAWYKNGNVIPGSSGDFYFANNLNDGDVFYCILGTGAQVCSEFLSTSRQSNSITIRVLSLNIHTVSPCLGHEMTETYNGSAAELTWKHRIAPGFDTIVKKVYAGMDPAPDTLLAGFTFPTGFVIDGGGNYYVGFYDAVFKYVPFGNNSYTNAGFAAGGNGQGSAANQIGIPGTLRLGPDGALYIADLGYPLIKKWFPGAASGVIVAGGLTTGSTADKLGGGTRGFCVDALGNIYVADMANNRIQKWAPGASVGVTVAGGNGAGNAANQLFHPHDVTLDAAGNNMYIVDYGNNRIVRWPLGSGFGYTVAGGNGQGDDANQLNLPQWIALDKLSNIYIGDANNYRIQKWLANTTTGSTVAGGNGQGLNPGQFHSIAGIQVNSSGNLFALEEGSGLYRGMLLKFSPVIDSTYTPADTGTYFVEARSFDGNVVTSNMLSIVSEPRSVSIQSDFPGGICEGMTINFTATALNGGDIPLYQWFVNGEAVEPFTPISELSLIAHIGDVITCRMTGDGICGYDDTATSNAITITTPGTPIVDIEMIGGNPVCAETPVTFIATTPYDLTGLFQWQKNGVNMGPMLRDNSYVDLLQDGDEITCQFLNPFFCVTDNPIINTVTAEVISAPDVSCPGDIRVDALPGLCEVRVPYQGETLTGTSLTYSIAPNSFFPIGTTEVTVTAANICETADCSFMVTVSDNEQPVALCKVLTVQLDANHVANVSALQLDDASYDNCSPVILSITSGQKSYDCDDVGQTFQVTLKAEDTSDNMNTCIALVTVADDLNPCCESPEAICKPATVNLDASGNATVTVADVDAGSTYDCGLQSITVSPATFDCGDVGTQNVTLTVTDVNGTTSNCSAQVAVRDVTSPAFTCPSNVTVNADEGVCTAAITIPVPAPKDNCGVASVTNDFNSTDNASGIYSEGTTEVNWLITDVHGLTNSCTQIINVIDNQAPGISCPADIGITANQSACNKQLTIAAATATDNCGVATITNNFTNTADASATYPSGTTSVIWTATDVHGLTANCTQTVTVYPCIQLSASVANTICTGTANGSITLTATGGHGSFSYLWSNSQTTANISGLAAGSYTVTVNDQSQGTATATFIVGTTVPTSRPVTPGAISGITNFCPNATNTYSIAAVPFAYSYTWIMPANAQLLSGQGTTQISVRFLAGYTNGNISVQAVNCLGISSKRNLSVGLFSIPAKPSSLAGSASICTGATHSYSINAVAGASGYTWAVPANSSIISGQGNTGITVQYLAGFSGGTISVFASNCMGNGTPATLIVAPAVAPAKPSPLTGTGSVCPNVAYQYFVPSVAYATSYVWTVPANATLISGQGTVSVSVRYNNSFTSGNISVYSSNCAGNSQAQSMGIIKTSKRCGNAKTDETVEDGSITAEPDADDFTVSAYPNPFANEFRLSFTGLSTEAIMISVYNVTGQLLEQREEKFSRMPVVLGNSLPANAVYFIHVKQQDTTKVLRLIKSQ